ncbi:hypothetical protein [Hellea balneolensis]|uniref:hypothetical protein n=1 Tax=Hellea balneolensis TaxID=287478 RepID=UPI0003FDFC10|nr:hypothetical protein [Hellea balneolensis]
MSKTSTERQPVIIGIGEYSERPDNIAKSLEPSEMMARALETANKDCGGQALAKIDSLDVVMPMSWRYSDLAGELGKALNISPKRAVLGPSGGQTPLKYIHEAAINIAEGRSKVAAVVGGEAQYSLVSAQRAGQMPSWSPFASDGPNFADTPGAIHPLSLQLGLYLPLNIYPLFEAATAAHWGQTPQEADAETAKILELSSFIAGQNPNSWGPVNMPGEEILKATPKNRIVAWPYTKSMVASMNVNQSAAIIITSLQTALDMGVAEDHCVFITQGAAANEPRDFLARANYYESPAQDAVLNALKSSSSATEAAELYSCFPVVPKMARRILGREVETASTVTGGMSFFGAPLNNYMTHASCAMVRKIRLGEPAGLLYGQGEYVTKHYGLRLSKTPGDLDILLENDDAQEIADKARGAVPDIVTDAKGPAQVESFAILSNRDGSPSHAAIMARLESGERSLAKIEGSESEAMAWLMDKSRYPIGDKGRLVKTDKGPSSWQRL